MYQIPAFVTSVEVRIISPTKVGSGMRIKMSGMDSIPDISTLQDTPEPASVLCAFPHLTLLPGKLLAQRAFQQVEDRGILTHV